MRSVTMRKKRENFFRNDCFVNDDTFHWDNNKVFFQVSNLNVYLESGRLVFACLLHFLAETKEKKFLYEKLRFLSLLKVLLR